MFVWVLSITKIDSYTRAPVQECGTMCFSSMDKAEGFAVQVMQRMLGVPVEPEWEREVDEYSEYSDWSEIFDANTEIFADIYRESIDPDVSETFPSLPPLPSVGDTDA